MSLASLLSRVGASVRAIFFRRRFEQDVDDEIRFHIEEHARQLVAQGIPEREAYRQARVAFGGVESSRDGVRRVFGLRVLDELFGDLRYGARILRNSPGFTTVAAGSLALAIGANTLIFSVANYMLFERLAVPRATELRMLFHLDRDNSVLHMSWGSMNLNANGLSQSDAFTYPVYQQMRQDAHGMGVDLFAFKDIGTVNASYAGSARAVQAELVSGNLYTQLGTTPVLGRGIQPADDGAPRTGAVVVLSYGLWQRMFGGAPDVVGKVLRVDTLPVTIVGVNAAGFTGAESVQRSPDLFLPMSMVASLRGTLGKEVVLQSTKLGWIQLMLRLPQGVPERLVQDRLNQSFNAATVATMHPKKDESVPTVLVADGSRGLAQSAMFQRQPLYVLLALVGCVLLLACANVANLMLARAGSRQREISVRLALGAGRSRVFRQLLVESLLLATLGGVGGAVLAYLGRSATPSLLRTAWDSTATPVPFNWTVFAFTAGITILTGLVFGLAPAWQSTRTDVNTALKQGARSATRQRKAFTGKGLVAFQIAVAMLLVAGSALFLRTMANLAAVHPGFEPDGLWLFEVQPPNRQYAGQKSVALHRELVQRFAAVPGVDGAAAASLPLISGSQWNTGARFEGEPEEAENKVGRNVNFNDVSPQYFSVMQIPIVSGRGFTDADTQTSPLSAVVNRAFVQTYLKGKNPLGVRVTTASEEVDGKQVPLWFTIVGVCGDTQYSDLRTPPGPIFFSDRFQSREHGESASGATYIIRSRLGPPDLVPQLRRAAADLDPDLPLVDVRTQVQQIRDVSRQERTFAALTACFGGLALALACVGIYGIMAYSVAQRTHEIGIRLALGAQRAHVRAMVLTEAMWISAAGLLAGTAATLALAHFVKRLLYQLTPYDPFSILLAAVLLMSVALLAGWMPAARASRLEPVIAIRQD